MNCLKRKFCLRPMTAAHDNSIFNFDCVFVSHGHTDTGDLMPNILDVY